MTSQEQQMIDGLIGRVRNTPIQDKDKEAEQHIQQGLSGYPDALYVLVQTVLVQQYGLEQAQSQIGELKQQVQSLQSAAQDAPKSSGGSFLSHIFGGGSNQASSTPQQQSPQYQPVNNPGYGSQNYPGGGYPPPPPPSYPAQTYPSSGGGLLGGGGLFGGGGGGGFLRGAMQTAAGVAAGEMMFQGMEDLFRGFGGHERGFAGGGGGETIVNNYYDDDRGSGADRDFADRDSGGDDRSFYNPDNDASRGDLGAGSNDFADSGSSDLGFADSSGDGGFDLGGSDDFSGDNS